MTDITVRFIDKAGVETEATATPGQTIMEVAVFNGIDSVIGLCGGIISCGTCICRIDDAAAHDFDKPGEEEADLLESFDALEPGARLGCQCVLKASDAGMAIRV